MIINQHEYGFTLKVGVSDVSLCVYCGAAETSTLLSCIDRSIKSAQTERRQMACYDIETIFTRIQELREEHDKILSETLEVT